MHPRPSTMRRVSSAGNSFCFVVLSDSCLRFSCRLRNLLNCCLSLFPSLVIFCWRCKPSLTGGGMCDMHSSSALPRFRHTRYGLATGFVNMRAPVSRVFRQPSGVANLRLGDWLHPTVDETQIPSGALGPSPTVGDGAQCRRQLGALSPRAAQLVRVLPRPLSSSRTACTATASCRRAPRCTP